MRIYREKDYDAMSRRAANLISAEVIRRPDCVLGLATREFDTPKLYKAHEALFFCQILKLYIA